MTKPKKRSNKHEEDDNSNYSPESGCDSSVSNREDEESSDEKDNDFKEASSNSVAEVGSSIVDKTEDRNQTDQDCAPCPPLQSNLSLNNDDLMFPLNTLPLPLPYNDSEVTSRKLLFDDVQPLDFICPSPGTNQSGTIFGNNSSVNNHTCEMSRNVSSDVNEASSEAQGDQDQVFPSPTNFASSFDEMNFFQSFQNDKLPIDESYCSNLLGGSFITSPPMSRSSDGPNMSTFSSSSQLINSINNNVRNLQAQYRGPTLNTTARSTSGTDGNASILPLLHRNNMKQEDNTNDRIDDATNKRLKQPTIGKSIDNLNQMRPKRPRKVNGRNLPLRKRHQTEMLTTPPPTKTRSGHRMVSRSTSVERKKRTSATSSQNSFSAQPISRNRSVRKSSMHKLDDLNISSIAGANMRVIQHFTPKRISPILSEEDSLPRTVIMGCKCSKSKCLKLYCDCFQAGQVCNEKCVCQNCLNTIEESHKDGRRTAAIQSILDRRPDAFDVRVKKTGDGCSCKKNRCLKKYCDCFNTGVKCDPNKCRCIDCLNIPTDDEHDFQDDEEENEYELECNDSVEDDADFQQLSDLKSVDQDQGCDEYHAVSTYTVPSLANTVPIDESFDLKEDITAV